MRLATSVAGSDGAPEVAMNTTTSPPTETLVRDQIRSLAAIGAALGFSEDRQRRALRMTAQRWAEWSAFLIDGPLPAWPKLPIMLRMLAVTTHRLAVLAEQQDLTFA